MFPCNASLCFYESGGLAGINQLAPGITGIVAYVVLMAAPVVSALRSPRTEHWALRVCAALGFSLGYVAMGLTDTMFVFEIPKSMYCLGAVIIMAFFLDAPPAARPR